MNCCLGFKIKDLNHPKQLKLGFPGFSLLSADYRTVDKFSISSHEI